MGDYWSRRKFLVTGGTGFLGRVVCRKLSEQGAGEVIAPGRRDYDLTHPSDVEKMFLDHAPDVVIHLAAQVGGIGVNMARPADLYLSNLLMGTYVLEQARRQETGKMVLLGTICSYPKYTPVPFEEESLWDGFPEETNAPYGIAKKALLVHAWANRDQYGQNAIYLLPTNLYGPGDKFNATVSHVIPALIKKCVDAKERGDREVVVWGSGSATREFLYVDDAAEGILLATERYDGRDPVNLGTNSEISIKDLAEMVAELCGFEGELTWDPSKPDGQPRRRIDATRAREAFGWEATTPMRDGLRRTIDWYLENPEEAELATI